MGETERARQTPKETHRSGRCSVLQYDAVCVLQCVAVCRSVLQCVAMCCCVMQGAAVCYSVLQCAVVRCSMSVWAQIPKEKTRCRRERDRETERLRET